MCATILRRKIPEFQKVDGPSNTQREIFGEKKLERLLGLPLLTLPRRRSTTLRVLLVPLSLFVLLDPPSLSHPAAVSAGTTNLTAIIMRSGWSCSRLFPSRTIRRNPPTQRKHRYPSTSCLFLLPLFPIPIYSPPPHPSEQHLNIPHPYHIRDPHLSPLPRP